jgi:hypothetical protein
VHRDLCSDFIFNLSRYSFTIKNERISGLTGDLNKKSKLVNRFSGILCDAKNVCWAERLRKVALSGKAQLSADAAVKDEHYEPDSTTAAATLAADAIVAAVAVDRALPAGGRHSADSGRLDGRKRPAEVQTSVSAANHKRSASRVCTTLIDAASVTEAGEAGARVCASSAASTAVSAGSPPSAANIVAASAVVPSQLLVLRATLAGIAAGASAEEWMACAVDAVEQWEELYVSALSTGSVMLLHREGLLDLEAVTELSRRIAARGRS